MRSPAVLLLLISVAACGDSSPRRRTAPTDPTTTDPVAAAGLKASGVDSPDVDTRRKALQQLLDEHWEYNLRTHPEFASMLGDHRWDDRWSDPSAQAIAADLEEQKKFLARFEEIDTTGFPEQEVLNQQLMVRDLKETLANAKFESWLMPVNQMSGPHLQLPQFVSLLRFTTVADYEGYLARLQKVPALLDQIVALMRDGMAKGLMPPKVQLELTVGQAEKLGKGKPEDSPFAQPVAKFPDDIAKADQDRLRTAILAAIKDDVLPAYRTLTAFLRDEYVPKGRKDAGVWALPDGEARYLAAIRSNTTTTMTADEIHELGLAEVKRIEAEQEAIGKTLGFKNLAAFRKHIRKNKKLYAKSREDILARYQKHTDAMYAKLPELFGRLPEQKMVILPTEDFRADEAAGAEYMPGAPDGSRPGMVRVNTSTPKKRLWIDMESTAYHEGVPGHHFQITIQQELPEMPPFRKFGGYTAFFEGWALYSERLGKEVGFYTDPYSDYGRLQDELLRAIRLVVDTGLHHKKWTRKQVVAFFHDHSTIDEPSVENETDRYIVWPGQALAYKIGQLTILRLRDKAQTALGEGFDIKAFHDTVLAAGALPLDVLEARVDAWIASASAGALK
jgi:uncharacterized protein (DUF885 family)